LEAERLQQLLQSAGLELPSEASVEVTGEDPAFAARVPIGDVAAAALAACGAQATQFSRVRTRCSRGSGFGRP
jgi:hypothetical protein